MEALLELGLFFGKSLVILFIVGSIFLMIALVIAKSQHRQELEIEPLDEKLRNWDKFLKSHRLNKTELKEFLKASKELEKDWESLPNKKQLFVLDFKGDVKASQVHCLREEVNAILQAHSSSDEVLVRIESPGGVVHTYGLASAQLARLRAAGLQLTVAVDEVAASGGYLMATVAHHIISSPFAILGSIGVVAQVPNFHRILKKNDVDYKEYTAGEYKRTVSIFGEITPQGEDKFRNQLEETHELFKNYVHEFRPQLDLAKVATGEYWFGKKALELSLVDKIQTSDDFILEKVREKYLVLKVKFSKTKPLQEKIAELVSMSLEKTLLSVWTKLEKQKFF